MVDIVKETLLQAKYARIIGLLADAEDISLEDAMGVFYSSRTMPLIEQGIGDLHCRSDEYLVDVILHEQE